MSRKRKNPIKCDKNFFANISPITHKLRQIDKQRKKKDRV